MEGQLTFEERTDVLPDGDAATLEILADCDLEKVDRNAAAQQTGEVWNEEGACDERRVSLITKCFSQSKKLFLAASYRTDGKQFLIWTPGIAERWLEIEPTVGRTLRLSKATSASGFSESIEFD